MRIHGKIYTDDSSIHALPEEAIIIKNGKPYIFLVEINEQDNKMEWVFNPVEIRTGISDRGWVEISLLKPLPENSKVALNNAYYLIIGNEERRNIGYNILALIGFNLSD